MNRVEMLKKSHERTKNERDADYRPGGKGAPVPKQGGPKTIRTRHLALRVTEALGDEVDKAAGETCRTASNWVETAIYWALEEGAVKTRQKVPRAGGGK